MDAINGYYAIVLHPELTPAERLILSYLWMRGDNNFRSFRTLAEELGVHRNTMNSAMKRLTAMGLVSREPNAKGRLCFKVDLSGAPIVPEVTCTNSVQAEWHNTDAELAQNSRTSGTVPLWNPAESKANPSYKNTIRTVKEHTECSSPEAESQPEPAQVSAPLSANDNKKEVSVSKRKTYEICKAAAAESQLSGVWTPEALVGLFDMEYERVFALGFVPHGKTLAEDIANAKVLLDQTKELAPWCIRALLSDPTLKGIRAKNLDWLSSYATQYVATSAAKMRDESKARPEWKKPRNEAPGVLNDPLARMVK